MGTTKKIIKTKQTKKKEKNATSSFELDFLLCQLPRFQLLLSSRAFAPPCLVLRRLFAIVVAYMRFDSSYCHRLRVGLWVCVCAFVFRGRG